MQTSVAQEREAMDEVPSGPTTISQLEVGGDSIVILLALGGASGYTNHEHEFENDRELYRESQRAISKSSKKPGFVQLKLLRMRPKKA